MTTSERVSAGRILALLDREADYARLLGRLVDAEEAEIARQREHPSEWTTLRADGLPEYFGVDRMALGNPKRLLDGLVWEDVLELAVSTRSQRTYRLVDREETKRALAAWAPATAPLADDEELPGDLFSVIHGHDDVKRVLTLTLARPRPVHALLVGTVGTAKTLFLDELRRLPRSCYADGASMTKAGLVEYLLAEEPRYLVVDQVDHLAPRDQQALVGVMSSGRVARLRYRQHQDELRHVWVFASANDTRRLSAALIDRFQVFPFRAYGEAEYLEDCRHFLVKREGADPELANYIALRLAPAHRSMRAAQRLARLATSVAEVDELLPLMAVSPAA